VSFKLRVSDDGYAAYLQLPGHPGEGVKVARTVSLVDVMSRFDGPHVVFDFDADGKMLGIEVVAVDPAEDEAEE
jgi:hypothetical protein